MTARDRLLLVFGALMVAGAILAHAMVPRPQADGGAGIDLETLVPKQFGHWQVVETANLALALPLELQEKQNEVYDQTLARTYVDAKGEHIMLTIAYGANQSRSLQVHRPEVCYSALGFQVLSKRKVSLGTTAGVRPIPAMQMVAAQNTRNEPVTYWIRIGDKVVRGNVELGLARVSYGLRGTIPDGVLFRVSNVTTANEEGFALQQRFVDELLAAVSPDKRPLLVGDLARPDR